MYRDLFIDENLTSEKKQRSENNLENFEVVCTYQGKVVVNKERIRGNEGTTHITTNSRLHQFIYRLGTSLTADQRSSTASHIPESVNANSPPPSPAKPGANTPEQETYQPLPPTHST